MTTPRHLELSGSLSPNPVIAEGTGSPLVFLHGPFGQEWTGFLDDLAQRHRVFAPANPGAEEPADLELLDDLHDLVLYYDEVFDGLGLTAPFDLVGHSYGGMVAAEYAAAYPGRIRRLVLIDPMGLWRDDAPVNEFINVNPQVLLSQLWADTGNPAVAARLEPPADAAAGLARYVRQFTTLASVSHFTFPIPERGLHRRLRRVRAKTLLVWGEQDGLVPPVYAGDFQRLIADTEVCLVPGAGHLPHVEQRDAVSRRTLDFLAG